MIQIEKITGELAQAMCQTITEDLPEYFGLPEANKHYAIGIKKRNCLEDSRLDKEYRNS
ncbi:hypothetical protein ACNVED_05425 [Legionella sp. D16C41]|uniref:hypothetical protein n=1 Tax=Legionella sp. D16C41 TaxID=3402688 RepID=UPI003AF4FB9A